MAYPLICKSLRKENLVSLKTISKIMSSIHKVGRWRSTDTIRWPRCAQLI